MALSLQSLINRRALASSAWSLFHAPMTRLQFGHVGREDVRARVPAIIRAFWINQNRQSHFPREGDMFSDAGQRALGVIGKHHQIMAGQVLLQQTGKGARVEDQWRFKIQPHQLLVLH